MSGNWWDAAPLASEEGAGASGAARAPAPGGDWWEAAPLAEDAPARPAAQAAGGGRRPLRAEQVDNPFHDGGAEVPTAPPVEVRAKADRSEQDLSRPAGALLRDIKRDPVPAVPSPKRSGSVLEGRVLEEPVFDPAEAGRLSRRDYADSAMLLTDPRRGAPAMRQGKVGDTHIDPSTARGSLLDGAPLPVRAGAKIVTGGVKALGGLTRAAGDLTGVEGVSQFGAAAAGEAGKIEAGMGKSGLVEGFGPRSPVPYLQDMAEGAASSLGTSALAAGALGAGAVIPTLAAMTAGQEYDEGRRAGLDPAAALLRAGAQGGLEALGEKLGGIDRVAGALGDLMKKGATAETKRSVADTLVRAGVREIPGEIATYLGQTGTDLLPGVGIRQDLTVGEFLQGLQDTVVQAGMMGGAMGAGGAAVSRGIAPARAPIPTAAEMVADRWGVPAADAPLEVVSDWSQVESATPVIPAPATAPAVAPVDRIQQLRDAGEEAAADLLQRRADSEAAGQELETLAGAAGIPTLPDFADGYRALRAGGMKPAEAAARAAVTSSFGEAALPAGLSEKAIAAARDAAQEIPLDKLPGFYQRFAAGMLAAQGGAVPDLAADLEAARDRALETVIGTVYQPAGGADATENQVADLSDSPVTTMRHIEALEAGAQVDTGAATVFPTAEEFNVQDASSGSPAQADAPADQAPAADPGQPAVPAAGLPAARPADLEAAGVAPEDPASAAAHQAATSPHNDLPEPTQAQKEAGNYKVGRLRIAGMDISVENPQGSVRRGVAADGTPWETPMQHHYGYVRGTTGADGDKLDVFVVPGTPEDYRGPVFVVDQVDPATGELDEHKVVLGARDEAEAERVYRSNYAADWQGLGAMTRLPMGAFKAWAKSGALNEPLGDLPERVEAFANTSDAAQIRADFAAAEKKRRAAGDGLRARAHDANPFRAFLGKNGINSVNKREWAPGIQEQRKAMIPGYGPVFRKAGMQLDELAQTAVEDGYLLRPDVAELESLIDRALRGERIIPQYAAGVAEDEMQARIDRQREFEEDAAEALDLLPDELLESDLLDDFDFSQDTATGNASDEDFLRALGATDEEIAHELAHQSQPQGRTAEGGEGAGQAADSDTRASGARSQGASQDEFLTSPTRGDVLASQARAERGDREVERQRAEDASRAKADAELGEFVLTGSDRPADVGGAAGQAGMFDRDDGLPPFSRGRAPDTPEFRRFFKDSKVVDAAGEPLVVYHGTRADVSSFGDERLGDATGAPSTRLGHFFTDTVSGEPAGWMATGAEVWAADREGSYSGGGNVMPVYLSIQNPKRLTGREMGQAHFDDRAAELRASAEAQGFDGFTYRDGNEEWFIAFRSEQIKSAIGNRGTFDPTDPDISQSRGTVSASRAARVQTVVDGIRKAWKNAPQIIVVPNMQDPAVPQRLREQDALQKSQGAEGEVEGFVHGGKVYLVADAIADDARAATVLLHESLGHYGLRGTFGESLRPILANMVTLRRADVLAKVQQYGLDPAQQRHLEYAAEEVLAEMAQEKPHLRLVERAVAAIRSWLREHVAAFRDLEVTDAEIIRDFILPARAFVERAARPAAAGGGASAVAFSRSTVGQLPDAIIGNTLGSSTSHPDYAAAKAGDIDAALRLARDLVTEEMAQKVRSAIGDTKPVIVPVAAEEAAGRNKIPHAVASVLARRLGLEKTGAIVQSNRPRRTSLDGLDRIFASPEFAGEVKAGQDYLMLDDTLTQGATFAALADHIRQGGGRVVGAVALTGKQYSATLQASPETLKQLRDKHGDLENAFRAATGYGYGHLTQSEARYLANFKPADVLRNRILAEGQRAGDGADGQDAGSAGASDDLAPLSRAAPAGTNAWIAPDPTRTDHLIYELQDGKVDLKRVQAAIAAAGQKIEERFDARLAETLYPGRVARRSQQFLDGEVKPLLEAMARAKVGMDDLADFLHARGAEERNIQIAKVNPQLQDGGAGTNTKGDLMTTGAARAYLSAIPAAQRQVLDGLAARVDAITGGTRQLLVAEGLEKRSTVRAWEAAYQHYVPMFREEAEAGEPRPPAHPTGAGFTVKGGSSKRATGSTKAVTNILAHVLMQREAAITRAEKNRVAMSLYGLALLHPNREFWTTIRPDMQAAQILGELQAMGVDPVLAAAGMQPIPTIRTVDPATNTVVDRPNPIYKTMPGAIVLRISGEDRVLMLNTATERGARLAESLKNLDGLTRFDLAGSIIGKTTRWMAAVNTQFNPVFGLVNFVRDTQGGVFNLTSTALRGQQAQVMGNVPAALAAVWRAERGNDTSKWSKLYRQFQADGGQTGYREAFRDANERTRAIERELAAAQKVGKVTPGKAAHAVLDVLDHFNTATENAVRLSAYAAALDKGLSRREAARLARELTVDFNRKGRATREVGPLYAFFNAGMQGSERTIRTLAGPAGKRIVAGGLALGVTQALMLAAAGYDEDEVPEYVKTRALVVPLPGEGKRFVTIPLPLGLHVLPNTGRILTEIAIGDHKDMGQRMVDAVGEIAGAFNPLGGGNIFTADGALRTIAPTVVDPVIEVGFNKNFAGASIEREAFGGERDARPGFARAREATQRSITGQAYLGISKAINSVTGGSGYEAGALSPTPERLRYLAQLAGGGVLRELERAVDLGGKVGAGEEVKTSAVPVASRFYGQVDDNRVQASRYMKNSGRIDRSQTSLKAAQKAGDAEAVQRILKDQPEVAMGQAQDQVQRSIAKLNQLAVQTIGDRETLRAIDQGRVQYQRALNEAIEMLEEGARGGPTLAARMRMALKPPAAVPVP